MYTYISGEQLVTRWELALTGLGLLLYVLDMLSDIGSAIFYAYYGEWWQYSLTLLFIYAPTIVSTARKLIKYVSSRCTVIKPNFILFQSSVTVDWLSWWDALLWFVTYQLDRLDAILETFSFGKKNTQITRELYTPGTRMAAEET